MPNEAFIKNWHLSISDGAARAMAEPFTKFWRDRSVDEVEFTAPSHLSGIVYDVTLGEFKDGDDISTSSIRSIKRIERDSQTIQIKYCYQSPHDLMCAETKSGSKYYFYADGGLGYNEFCGVEEFFIPLTPNGAFIRPWFLSVGIDIDAIAEPFAKFWRDHNMDEFEFTVPCHLTGAVDDDVLGEYTISTSNIRSIKRIEHNPQKHCMYPYDLMCAETNSGGKYHFYADKSITIMDGSTIVIVNCPPKTSILARSIRRIKKTFS